MAEARALAKGFGGTWRRGASAGKRRRNMQTGNSAYDPATPSGEESATVEETKTALLTKLAALDRGLAATRGDRERVDELVKELESASSTSGNGVQSLLGGRWALLYSSTFAGTSSGSQGYPGSPIGFPFRLGQVSQVIDLEDSRLDNELEVLPPTPFEGVSARASLKHELTLDGKEARITFTTLSVQPQGALSSLPDLNLPSPFQALPSQLRGSEFEERAGSFETTFIDGDIRVSRSGLSELRIFSREPDSPSS